MPLPPIPLADWLSHTADQWRKRQQTQLDQLREQASGWDLHAQRAVHGIGDTFSGLGTAVQEALPEPPTPPPMPQFELPQPVQDLGASVGGAFSDLGSGIQSGVQGAREAIQSVAPPAPDWSQQAQAAVDSIGSAAGGAAEALSGAPSLSPMGLGANLGASLATGQATPTISTLHDLGQAARTTVIDPGLAVLAASRAGERQDYGGFVDRMYGATPGGAPVGPDRERLLDYLQFNADVGSSVAGSSMQPGPGGLPVGAPPPGGLGAAGAAADDLTAALAEGAPRFGAPVPAGGLPGAPTNPATALGNAAGAALDAAAQGVRRVQRGVRRAMPRLTPEQHAQRAADGAAEQRVFDAIQQLWRQGPEGEALADDLRFLAVGKGEEGEAAARDLLTRRGRADLLPPAAPPEAGAAPGVLGVGALGAGLGLPGAALGQDGQGPALPALPSLEDLNTRATGFLNTQGDRLTEWLRTNSLEPAQAALAASRDERTQDYSDFLGRLTATPVPGTDRAGGLAPEKREQLAADASRYEELAQSIAGGLKLRTPAALNAGNVTDVLSSAPLMSPPSQAANLLAGGFRSLERIALELAEGRPIDALLDAGTTGKTLLSPSTWKKAGQAFGTGPTPRNPGATGATGAGSLANAPGRAAKVLTSGTRANASMDEVIRTANEEGARAVGARRGLTGQALDDFIKEAGDYATITGANSPLANALTHAKGWMTDPAANPAQKTLGHVANALSGYVNMPERVMMATMQSLASPAIGAYKLGKGALTRDPELARKGAARLLYGGVLDWKLAQMAGGDIPGLRVYGPPPSDQGLREEMEREGARWEAFVVGDPRKPAAVIPTRNAGVWGQQAALIGGLYLAAVQADREGRTGPLKGLDLGNQLFKQTLSDSYLSDYAEFANKIDDLKGIQSAATTLAGYPSRVASVLAGPANASDPYVRETNAYEGFGPALSRAVPGGRYLLPTKTDPTTGEPVRRRGTGWERYWGAESGTQLTPQAEELSRLGLNARDFRAGEYAGEKQTPQVLATVKRYVGGETGKAVREAMTTPAYQKADDAGKTKLLEKALRDADFEAELRVGDGVKRSAKAQAAWEYSATAKYTGAPKDGDANAIRRYNRSVSQARAAKAEARKKDAKNPDRAEAEWARANPEEAKLARRGAVSATTLRKKKAEIYAKHKVTP